LEIQIIKQYAEHMVQQEREKCDGIANKKLLINEKEEVEDFKEGYKMAINEIIKAIKQEYE